MPPLTSLEVDPDTRLEFPKDSGGGVRLRLTNVTTQLIAYKVKSTARSSYIIKPSAGSIRRGEAAEVQIQRRVPEDSAEVAEETGGKARKSDRFLVQAVVVDTDERKLLLHAANRGKGQGTSKFWDGVSKEELEEKQLEAVLVEGIGNGTLPEQTEGSGDKGGKVGKDKGSKCAAALAGNSSNDADIDTVLHNVSKPGRVRVESDRDNHPAPPGFDAPREGVQVLHRSGSPGRDEPAAARLAPATTLKKAAKRAHEDVVINKHSRPVTCVTCHPSGKEFITCAKDKLVCAWSCPQGEFLRQYEGHRGAVWACSVTSDGLLLLTCGADNMVLLWEAASAQKLMELQLSGVARHVDWAPYGERSLVGQRQFVACCNNFKDRPAAVSVYDSQDTCSEPTLLFAIKEPALPSPATQANWAGSTSDILCTVHQSGEVLFWNGDNGELLGKLEPHDGLTSMVAFASDRSLMASCGRVDMCVRLWDLDAGLSTGQAKCLQSYQVDRPLNAVGLRAAITRVDVEAAEGGGRVGLFDCLAGGGQDARDVALVGAGTDDQFDPVPMRMGPDGEMTAYVSGEALKAAGHFGPINFVCFTPDGSQCISGAEDGNVRIRDLMTSSLTSPRPRPQPAQEASAPTTVQPPPQPPPEPPPPQPQSPPQPTSLSAALSGQPPPKAQQPKAQQPKAQAKSQQKAQAKAKEPQQAKVELATQISPNSAKAKQPPLVPPMSPLDSYANRYISVYDFDPRTTGWPFPPQYTPLQFTRGQEIEVIQALDGNGTWAYGRIGGTQAGLFPMNYVLPKAIYHQRMADSAKAKVTSPMPSPVTKPMPSPPQAAAKQQPAVSPLQKPMEAPSLSPQEASRPGLGIISPLGLNASLLGLGGPGGLGLSPGLAGAAQGGYSAPPLSQGLSGPPLSQGFSEGLTGGGLLSGLNGSGFGPESMQKPAEPPGEDDEEGCSQS